MTVLVVGANSFSGSHFCKYLLTQGYNVLGVSRNKDEPSPPFNIASWSNLYNSSYTYCPVNIRSVSEVNKLEQMIGDYHVSKVVNFAAQGMVAESWLSPLDWYETNIIGQVRLLESLRKYSGLKRYLHISTPEVYGNNVGWVSETMNFSPSTPYAVSRAAFDLHLNAYVKAYEFPCIWTRAANVYGPGQQLYRVIPRAFLSALTGETMIIQGGGVSERSFIHIEDVCAASLEILEKGTVGDTYHISTNELIKIRNLVEKIFSICNADFDKIVQVGPERLGKDAAYKLDSSKIRSQFTWSEKINLNDGLYDVYKWISKHLKTFRSLNWEYEHKT